MIIIGIKICTFADFHLGVTSNGKTDPITGLNTRIIDALNSFDTMVDYIIDNDIRYVICAGDSYKNSLPSPTLQKEFNKRIKRLLDNNIKVYILDGNHDVSIMPQMKSALDPFDTLEVDNIYHTRFKGIKFIEDKLKLIFLPTYTNEEEIEQILKDETWENIPTLIIGHLSLKGAKLNDWLVEKNEEAVNVTVFNKPNVIGTVLGHLHRYQILSKEPLIYYTGSLQRIDFTEEKQKKGFVILDIDNNNIKHEFIEVNSQKFCTINIDLTNNDDIYNIIDENKEKIEDAIVRIYIKLKPENEINEKEIIDYIYKFGPANVTGIQKQILQTVERRNVSISNDIPIEKALELYFDEYENKDDIIKEGLNLISNLSEKGVL